MSRLPQTSLLIAALKRALKARGVTYAQVAQTLELSEASVKRVFSEESFTLQRLEQVASLAGLSLTELARMVEDSSDSVRQLTEEQEQLLVEQPRLFLVFYLLLNQYTLEDIVRDYEIEQLEGVRLLARLDRMGLIELQPGNCVRLRTSRFLAWRETGPIRRFFDERIREEFFESRFDQGGELLKFVSGMLSRASLRVMERKLALLAQEFTELSRLDASLPLEERHGCSVMLAQRLWKFSLFSSLARRPEQSRVS
jgi:transcriptional regulator with XRE-family HTH domain